MMETFQKDEYYVINCTHNGYKKLYTAHITAVDETHIAIRDATGDEFVLPRTDLNGQSRKISKEKFDTTSNRIAIERRQREVTQGDVQTYYKP
jgi:hypothetical protein